MAAAADEVSVDKEGRGGALVVQVVQVLLVRLFVEHMAEAYKAYE